MFLKDLIYSNNVHDLRKDRNISQNKMAEDLGVSRRTISKIENCDQNLSLEMAYRISAYFNLLIPEVFPLTEKEKWPTCIGTDRLTAPGESFIMPFLALPILLSATLSDTFTL